MLGIYTTNKPAKFSFNKQHLHLIILYIASETSYKTKKQNLSGQPFNMRIFLIYENTLKKMLK